MAFDYMYTDESRTIEDLLNRNLGKIKTLLKVLNAIDMDVILCDRLFVSNEGRYDTLLVDLGTGVLEDEYPMKIYIDDGSVDFEIEPDVPDDFYEEVFDSLSRFFRDFDYFLRGILRSAYSMYYAMYMANAGNEAGDEALERMAAIEGLYLDFFGEAVEPDDTTVQMLRRGYSAINDELLSSARRLMGILGDSPFIRLSVECRGYVFLFTVDSTRIVVTLSDGYRPIYSTSINIGTGVRKIYTPCWFCSDTTGLQLSIDSIQRFIQFFTSFIDTMVREIRARYSGMQPIRGTVGKSDVDRMARISIGRNIHRFRKASHRYTEGCSGTGIDSIDLYISRLPVNVGSTTLGISIDFKAYDRRRYEEMFIEEGTVKIYLPNTVDRSVDTYTHFAIPVSTASPRLIDVGVYIYSNSITGEELTSLLATTDVVTNYSWLRNNIYMLVGILSPICRNI